RGNPIDKHDTLGDVRIFIEVAQLSIRDLVGTYAFTFVPLYQPPGGIQGRLHRWHYDKCGAVALQRLLDVAQDGLVTFRFRKDRDIATECEVCPGKVQFFFREIHTHKAYVRMTRLFGNVD